MKKNIAELKQYDIININRETILNKEEVL